MGNIVFGVIVVLVLVWMFLRIMKLYKLSAAILNILLEVVKEVQKVYEEDQSEFRKQFKEFKNEIKEKEKRIAKLRDDIGKTGQ